MALSDKFTLTQIKAAVRREIMDAGTRWVSDAELGLYANEWQYMLQLQHELVWNSTTHTLTGSSTATLTDVSTEVLKPGYVFWSDVAGSSTSLLAPRNKDELSLYDAHWYEASATNTLPVVVYQENIDTISFWPFLTSGTWTFVLEYPIAPVFAADTSTHEVPAWTRYSSIPYIVWKCYERNGAIHNAEKATRYRAIFDEHSLRIGRTMRNFWPKRSPALRPVVEYENRILNPRGVLEDRTAP